MPERRRYLTAALVVAIATAGTLAFALAHIGRSAAFPFRSLTRAELASGGVEVSAATPPADLATTAAEAATAARKYLGHRVLEVRYVRCVDSLRTPKLDHDCWAVSIDPRGVVTPGPATTRWDLAFVAADTGKVIEARLG